MSDERFCLPSLSPAHAFMIGALLLLGAIGCNRGTRKTDPIASHRVDSVQSLLKQLPEPLEIWDSWSNIPGSPRVGTAMVNLVALPGGRRVYMVRVEQGQLPRPFLLPGPGSSAVRLEDPPTRFHSFDKLLASPEGALCGMEERAAQLWIMKNPSQGAHWIASPNVPLVKILYGEKYPEPILEAAFGRGEILVRAGEEGLIFRWNLDPDSPWEPAGGGTSGAKISNLTVDPKGSIHAMGAGQFWEWKPSSRSWQPGPLFPERMNRSDFAVNSSGDRLVALVPPPMAAPKSVEIASLWSVKNKTWKPLEVPVPPNAWAHYTQVALAEDSTAFLVLQGHAQQQKPGGMFRWKPGDSSGQRIDPFGCFEVGRMSWSPEGRLVGLSGQLETQATYHAIQRTRNAIKARGAAWEASASWRKPMAPLFGLGVLGFFAWIGFLLLKVGWRRNEAGKPSVVGRLAGVAAFLISLGFGAFGGFATWVLTGEILLGGHGRPFRRRSRIRVASVTEDESWSNP